MIETDMLIDIIARITSLSIAITLTYRWAVLFFPIILKEKKLELQSIKYIVIYAILASLVGNAGIEFLQPYSEKIFYACMGAYAWIIITTFPNCGLKDLWYLGSQIIKIRNAAEKRSGAK